MERSHSWDAVSFSATQDILRILQNSEVHYRVHNSAPLLCSLSQTNSLHTFPSCFLKIQFHSMFPSASRSSRVVSFPKISPLRPYIHLFSPMRGTCPAYLSCLTRLHTRSVSWTDTTAPCRPVCKTALFLCLISNTPWRRKEEWIDSSMRF